MKREQYEKVPQSKLIIRDHLAADRTVLANDRTLLAYIRTAFALVGGGIGIIKLFNAPTELGWRIFGWILISVGAVIQVYGIIRFFKYARIITPFTCASVLEAEEEAI
ncbi:MAG: DUF202 domain-containing protein [Candidatus Heimdallarchaeota archaeon]|nr:DUF202 domain-containing protein [Candidatus Heimdallarchaeota archaeon]